MKLESKYQWTKAPEIDSSKQLVKQLLINRGIDNQAALSLYLHPNSRQLSDPKLLHDMSRAVDIIKQSIAAGEKITIYGDYDADGMTSISLMYDVLSKLGANVDYYVPDRFRDGYGPNLAAYQKIVDSGTKLVITVDNGVSGKDVIDPIVEQTGLKVVITDHHQLPAELPTKALAIVHPDYPGSHYPFKDLSGVGVALMVAWQLLGKLPVNELDLVAIGEIADVVGVTDENRLLIAAGLKVLSHTQRFGLQELKASAGLLDRDLNSTDVGFQLAPRLNALGRIGNSTDGVRLLTTKNRQLAQSLADKTEVLNNKRKDLTASIVEQARARAEHDPNQALIIRGQGWHQGVLGLVASRVLEATGKPTVVVSNNPGSTKAKGSGRSRDGFDLYAALDPHRDLMLAFGGHPQACGLSVDVSKIDELQAAFNAAAVKQGFSSKSKPGLTVDVFTNAKLLNHLNVVRQIGRLQPYGPGNLEPVIGLHQVIGQNFYQMGSDNQHLKFYVDGLACIWFNCGPEAKQILDGQRLDLVGTLNLNYWQGKVSVQFLVKDLRTAR